MCLYVQTTFKLLYACEETNIHSKYYRQLLTHILSGFPVSHRYRATKVEAGCYCQYCPITSLSFHHLWKMLCWTRPWKQETLRRRGSVLLLNQSRSQCDYLTAGSNCRDIFAGKRLTPAVSPSTCHISLNYSLKKKTVPSVVFSVLQINVALHVF